jgi:hypothetical protein
MFAPDGAHPSLAFGTTAATPRCPTRLRRVVTRAFLALALRARCARPKSLQAILSNSRSFDWRATPDSDDHCASRGYQFVETYVEPGASATNDRRPEFQRMIEAGTSKPVPFDVVIVHSFSRSFRDDFDMEFYGRHPADGAQLRRIRAAAYPP